MKINLYPQRTETDCLLACVECLVQQPREAFEHLVSYFDGGYLRYTSAARIINAHSLLGGLIVKTIAPTLHLDPVLMILGLRMKHHVVGGPLHAVFWAGDKAWEPATCTMFDINPADVKVAYALMSAASSNNRVGISTANLDLFESWDQHAQRAARMPADERAAIECTTGSDVWLEVRQ